MSRWKPDAAGRLTVAALALFAEQGYQATTIAEITERAGLTQRTFFRHFSDKREVLFSGSDELVRLWLEAVSDAPPEASAMAAVAAGFEPVAQMFVDRHDFARTRARIVAANPELMERELMKLQGLAEGIEAALVARGAAASAATLAAQAGVTVFHVAFARWVQQRDPTALGALMIDSLRELHSVTDS